MKKYKFLVVSVLLAIVLFVALLSCFYAFSDSIRFNYIGVISFYFVSAILIIMLMEILMQKMSLNASYVYLLTIVLKVGFFMLIFNKSVFGIEGLVKLEKLVIIVPMFVFLGIEAFYLMKKMND